MQETKASAWPLLFTYSGPIIGQGYLASVRFCGRLLASLETEGFWIDGVNPGGFAVGGKSFDEANLALRDSLTKILVDYACETESFETFKAAVEAFYHESDEASVRAWAEALAALKAGTLQVPAGIQRRPAEWACSIEIERRRLEDLTPRDNSVNLAALDTALPLAA